MASPLSFWKNKKNFIIVFGGSSVLFFVLFHYIFQTDQAKRNTVAFALPKHSINDFNQTNGKINERRSALINSQKKSADQLKEDLKNQITDLQKKIFQQQAAAQTANKNANTSSSSSYSAPSPTATRPKPITPKTNVNVGTATPPVVNPYINPNPVIIPRPRTTVS